MICKRLTVNCPDCGIPCIHMLTPSKKECEHGSLLRNHETGIWFCFACGVDFLPHGKPTPPPCDHFDMTQKGHSMDCYKPPEPEKKECLNQTLQCSCGKIVSHDAPDVRQPPPPPCDPHHTCGILTHKMGCDCDLHKPLPAKEFSDAEEQEIFRIIGTWGDSEVDKFHQDLKGLVRLARGEKA